MGNGRLVKTASWVEDNGLVWLQSVGVLFLTGLAVWVPFWLPDALKEFKTVAEESPFFWLSQKTFWLTALAVVMSLWGGVGGGLASKKKDQKIEELEMVKNDYSQLRKDFEDTQLSLDDGRRQILETLRDGTHYLLGHIAREAFDFKDTERISLFLNRDDQFFFAGRFSSQPDLNKPGRSYFPANEGCVGKTWHNNGEYFQELPEQGSDEYRRLLKEELNIDDGQAEKMRMKSRSYFSRAVVDGYHRVGVVVFESTLGEVFDIEKLRMAVDTHQQCLLAALKQEMVLNPLLVYQGGGMEQ